MRALAMQSTDTSEESRAFLQQRVTLLWAALFGINLLGNGLDSIQLLTGHPFGMSYVLSLLGTSLSASLWLVSRRGVHSIRFSRRLEAGGLIASAVLIAVMGRHLVASVGPAITEVLAATDAKHPLVDAYLSMMMILGAALMVAIRAALVPSSLTRTVVITVLVGVPFVLATTFVEPPHDGYLAWRTPHGKAGLMLPVTMSMWWGFTVITCGIISRILHGLRDEISSARRLGQYVLERKLGEGGMGIVYRAQHGMMRRPSAVKLLPPDRAGDVAVRRFEREVRQTARLTHPNTITIFDYGRTADGVFYYAMELLDGATLEEIVETDGAQPVARVVRALSMACGALAEAHAAGLIHRDIKPANIMLCTQGGELDVVKVLDFGLVKDLQVEPDLKLTGADSVSGTPLYMAPECIKDPTAVDERTDIYALGATGYHFLTGTDVFSGGSMIEVCGQHLHEEPEPPSTRLGKPVPEQLEQLLLACLAKDPADRPQSVVDVRRQLATCTLEPWTEDDAAQWWAEHGRSVRARHEPTTGIDAKGRTIAVARARDLSEPAT